MPYAGSRFDVIAPGAGEVTRLPVVLLDDDGAPVTGETFDAAGMDVEYAKPGGTFTDFPTFDTNNWHEVGRGVYEVIVRGDDLTEAALLDTEGMFLLYVATTASSAKTALHAYKVSTADVVREDVVATAPANFEDLSITDTTGRVDIGAVGGTTVDGPGDLGGGSGTGARTIVFTLSDGAGTLAGSLKTQVEDSEGNLVAGPLATDSSGVVTYYLDDGSYSLVSASSAHWQGNSEDVTVSASAAVAVTLTAQALPVPSAADKYTVIIDAADEYGDLVGASAWAIKVLNVLPRGLSTANLVQLTEQNPITTDANGRASFEIAQETNSLTVSIAPKLADGTTGGTLTFTVEVSADDADDNGVIYFADLLYR